MNWMYGDFVIDSAEQYGEFEKKVPGPFQMNYQAWSEAKLDAELQKRR